MNQRRSPFPSGNFVDNSRSRVSSLNESNHRSKPFSQNSFDSAQKVSNTKTQPVLYDTPPASTGQSHFQSVSRATPVQRPRPETAIPFVPDEYKERLRKSKLARSRTLSESFDEPDLYSIEEHRDELSSVPSTTHQYSTLHPKSQNYQSLTYHSNTDKHSNTSTTGYFDSTGNDASNILSEVESLLSLHLPSSTSYSSSLPNSLKYQQKDHPTAAAVTTPARTSSSQFASQSSSSSTYHPQLYPIPSQHQQSAQRLQHLYSPTTINCTTPHSFSSSSSNNVSTNQRLLPTYSCTIPNSSHYNSSTLPFNKPQVYCTEQREVERFTYRPGAVTPNTTITSSPSTQSTSTKITPAKIQRYPIVELSIPKSDSSVNQSKSVDHHDYHRLIGDYSDTTQTDSNNRSSYSRYSSNQPTVPESPLNVYSHHHHHHHHHSHQPPESEQSFSQANQEPIKTSSSSQSHSSRSNQTSSSNHSNRVTIDLLSPSSLDRSFYEQAGLSGVRGGIGCESRIKTSTKPLDISSLDALLESTFSDLYDDDMSKSTKEWHSSFSTMRDRFGNHDLLDEFVNRFDDFTTNGSLTLPRRGGGLSKSASQGSMTLGRRSAQSSSYSRNNSLLADAVDAVERTVSDASESSRKNSRQELNDFWAETVRNSSNSGSIQRPSGQLNAAQRLEMLHESLDMQRGMEMRYSRGERIAERRAQFLKETIQSSNSASSPSALTDRFFTQRSVPSSNGYMQNEASFQIDVSENETTTTIHKKNKEANESVKQPNFSALDNAVAELSTTTTSHQQYTVIRSGGCARFPTDDLNSLSPTSRKDSSNNSTQLHSPSPDAGSDTGSAYNAPSGLPHPKPKHNIREQLIQAGFELRGFSYSRTFGARFTSSPNFPVPSNGSVASRISEFEKRPGAPNLLQIACALSGISQRTDVTAMRSPIGPMSPRSSVYRTKPIIHADFGGISPKPHTETSGSPTSVFEFPPSKQLFDVKEEVSYYNKESISIKNEAEVTIISTNLDKVSLDSVQPRRAETIKVSIQNRDNQQALSPSIAERRLEKNANATLPAPLRTDAVAPTSSTSIPSPPAPRKVRPISVPRFYFPKGKPISMAENEASLRRASDVFSRFSGKVDILDMTEVCKAAGIPIYWKRAVYDSCCGAQSRPITLSDFSNWWSRMTSAAHDEASRFIYALAGSERNYIVKEDLAPLLQDVIDTFPGLHFLREAQEFHARYVETVTVRIFWSVNRSWSGRITANELRRSNFLETVRKLETTDDINTITDYFSYEHFYVIYCKFYEIDKDHNLIINKIDMSQHCNGAIPPRVIDRIFSGAVTRAPPGQRTRETVETVNYTDFVAFLLAEEDKKHPTSIEYWFRVLDLDGDGLLSLYEMEYFYNGVKTKMDQHNIDSMRFDDVVCNLLDLVRPQQSNVVTLSDLKKCSMCTKFFNTFVNWVKYYEQESSEGERATVTDGEEELSDWDRYCLEEYEALMADDQENEEPEDINLNLDDDDDAMNGGTNVCTTVNMPLREFADNATPHSTALEAL